LKDPQGIFSGEKPDVELHSARPSKATLSRPENQKEVENKVHDPLSLPGHGQKISIAVQDHG